MIPTVLSIAGLDPSGGAGLAADLKTATMLDAYGMGVITAVTVQHPGEVLRSCPIEPDLVREQIEALLVNMRIDAIKIGMLGSSEVARAVFKSLETSEIPIVLDPIGKSTTGQVLNPIQVRDWTPLLSKASIVTPNDDEIESLLCGTKPHDWVKQTQTALLHTGGGDEPGYLEDVLWLPSGEDQAWRHPVVETQHTHGTGCTLSTAIAVGMAQGLDVQQAVAKAIGWTGALIAQSADGGIVEQNGPLLHFMNRG